MDPALWEMLEGEPEEEIEAIIRLRQAGLPPPGVRLVAQFGEIATCRLRRSSIRSVREDEAVTSLKAPRLISPEDEIPPSPAERIPEDEILPTDVRRPTSLPETGRGVILGVVDWGCDFAYPGFRNAEGSTRLLALWDQSAPYDSRFPNRYGYGRIYTAQEINRALSTSDPYPVLGYHPADSDIDGQGSHGTHVLDIAAGNGRNGGPLGIAPETELVFVHLASKGTEGLANLGDSVRLLEAVDFIAQTAGSTPWVVNLSVGRHGGPHDGSTLVEQGFDALLAAAPGRAIVQSTGNYFSQRIHSRGRLGAGESATLTVDVDEADLTPNEIEVWYSGQDLFVVEVSAPDGTRFPPVAPGEQLSLKIEGREVGRVYHRAHDPNNQDHHVDIFLYPGGPGQAPGIVRAGSGAPGGEWQIKLTGKRINNGVFHAWIERDPGCRRCQSRFPEEESDPSSTTGTICNGHRTLVAGAYNPHSPGWELGSFSSAGPTRDGRAKPDLLAPGVEILAARSTSREKGEETPLLTRKSGTSMAAPHLTGTVALMFEAAGRPLEIKETRELLLTSARATALPEYEHIRAGRGYLDVERAVTAARRLSGQRPAPPAAQMSAPSREASFTLFNPFDSGETAMKPEEKFTGEENLQEILHQETEGKHPLEISAEYSNGEMGDAFVRENANGDEEGDMKEENYQKNSGFSEKVLEFVEEVIASSNGFRASGELLEQIFSRAGMAGKLAPFAESGGYFSLPAAIFDAFAPGGSPGLRRHFEQFFEVVAFPGSPLAEDLQQGDLLIRRALGEGSLAHLAFISAPEQWQRDELISAGLFPECGCPGRFARVTEGGARPHFSTNAFARRISDAGGRMPTDQMIIRLKSPLFEHIELLEEGYFNFPQETTARVTFRVRNRIIRNDAVTDCDIELVSGANRAGGRTNASGNLRLDISGLPDGDYQFHVVPVNSSADPVGPAMAATAPSPARIWRTLDSTVTVRGGRIINAGHANISISGNTLDVRLQPVWMKSPNRSSRPAGTDPTLIIVHHTGGTTASSAINTFMNPGGTSAHYVIDTDGQVIKMVHESEQAHHAGCSHWAGQEGVNRFSVGIEIVHQSGAYPAAQYSALTDLLTAIRAAHRSIPERNIVGHSDIGICIPGHSSCNCAVKRLGRKSSDPGEEFEWERLEAAGLGIPLFIGPLRPGLYGGFFDAVPGGRLREGDNDANQRYGGSRRPTLTHAIIAELQTDLSEIGYFCPVNGTFDIPTRWAVQMFQEHFFSGTRRRSGPGFNRGQVDQLTAETIKRARP